LLVALLCAKLELCVTFYEQDLRMQNTKLNAAYRLQTVTLYGHMDFHSQATSADGKKASTNGQVQLLKKR